MNNTITPITGFKVLLIQIRKFKTRSINGLSFVLVYIDTMVYGK
jgi:hypothetical protein